MRKTLREHDDTRNARFAATCKVLELDGSDDIRKAFWAGIACGLLEQLLDDARMTEDTARAAFSEYLKGAKQ
jgi:hypothetical protein